MAGFAAYPKSYYSVQQADLISENEERRLHQIEADPEPCDLYSECRQCPNWIYGQGCGMERSAA
jgi:hypothetical protein